MENLDDKIPDYLNYYIKKSREIDLLFKLKLETKAKYEKSELDNFFNYLWIKTERNLIIDSELLCAMLNHYIDLLDNYKCHQIASLLKKHYPTSINYQIQKWIEEEKYEKCQTLNIILEKIN